MLTKADLKRLVNEQGYKLAREYTLDPSNLDPKTGKPLPVPHKWPDDPPEKKNRIVLTVGMPSDPRYAEEYFVTSTRAITIGRELPGGKMGERYGIICAEDGRNKTQFVLGGGKVQPDFDGTESTRLTPGADYELVRGAVVAEVYEELRIPFTPALGWDDTHGKDHSMWGKKYFLLGLRLITDKIFDEASGRATYPLKKESGLVCADACFLAITHERLGYFGGQPGETGPRHVKPASELLQELTREGREKGTRPILPFAQALALAQAIVVAKEVFGDKAPGPLKEVIADGEEAARRVIARSPYAKNFIKVAQEVAWEP